MDITAANIRGLSESYSVLFNKGLESAKSYWRTVAMDVPSSSRANNFAWLAATPGIRRWVGDRIVHNLGLQTYVVTNETYEETIGIPRTAIEDDEYGVYAPIAEKLGHDTAEFPDEKVFGLMNNGFTERGYDGQYFFDTDHLVGTGDKIVSVSNMQAGDETPWYLLDCSKPIKPMIFQNRIPFKLTPKTNEEDENVFWKDEFVWGTRGRCNAGFGLWQLAYASKEALTAANYESARTAMQSLKNDHGGRLNITPTHLVVPPSLEGEGRRLLKALAENGGTNEWAGSAELIITPYLG